MNQENKDHLKKLVMQEMERHFPITQEECCLIGARVAIAAGGSPIGDNAILWSAVALAKGLFGDSYDKADEFQRIEWIDACETAVRKACKEVMK